MHRHADSVEMAMRSNLIDSFGSGVIQTGPGWLYLAPTYYAQQLYTRSAGSYPVRVQGGADAHAMLPWHMEDLDLSAVLSADGRMLRVYGVNSTEKAVTIRTELNGFSGGVITAEAYVLKDSQGGLSSEILNSRDEPERIRAFRHADPARGSRFALEFDPLSLTLFELALPGVR